jgi:hypothetical protein
VDPRIESHVGSEQGIDGHRGHHVGGASEGFGFEQSEARDAGHQLRSVDERQTFLGGQSTGFRAAAGLGRLLVDPDVARPSPISSRAT